MVYAALCLKRDGVPDPEEVGRWLDRIKNNCSDTGRKLVVYMGRDWRPNSIDMTLAYKGSSLVMFFIGLLAFAVYSLQKPPKSGGPARDGSLAVGLW